MKKRLLTLFALMLGVCSGAWADTTIFSMSSVTGPDESLSPGTIKDITATFVGGKAEVKNGHGSKSYNMYYADGGGTYVNLAGSGGSYIHIILDAGRCLEVGDKIAFTYSGDGTTLKISATTTSGSDKTLADGAYTVTSDDGLAGATDIYIFKSNINLISAITITGEGEFSGFALSSSSEVAIAPEATSQITYTSSSTGAVTYTSSAPSVATVSETGLITGVKPGSATITVSQAAVDGSYRSGKAVITVDVQKTTTHTGEWILDTDNGSRSSNTYTTTDGSLIFTGGSLSNGNGTYGDLKDTHFKHKGDITFTLPSNYPVSSVWFVGYSNGSSNQTITLKSVDGSAVTPQSGTLLNNAQKPVTDCVAFELESAATKSMVINISNECRGYFILNPAAQDITLTQVGENYYASYYSAGEITITGATAYTAELNGDKTALTLTECAGGVVPARTGVILIGSSASATATPSFTGATKEQGSLIGVAQKAVSMSNYYAKSTSAAGKVFVLGAAGGKAGLYKYTGTSLAVNKAYLYDESLASASSIEFTFDDETTGIRGVGTDKVKKELKKFFENGQLVIEKNGVKYNVAGQQLK